MGGRGGDSGGGGSRDPARGPGPIAPSAAWGVCAPPPDSLMASADFFGPESFPGGNNYGSGGGDEGGLFDDDLALATSALLGDRGALEERPPFSAEPPPHLRALSAELGVGSAASGPSDFSAASLSRPLPAEAQQRQQRQQRQ